MINIGKEKNLEELLIIYMEMIEKAIIFEDNELHHGQFKNIVTLALRLHKLKWTEEFINQYRY